MNRRETFGAISWLGLVGMTEGAQATDVPTAARIPKFKLLYECDVMLSETLSFGATAEGERRIIPITGGSFKGPEIKGQVLAIGADWNLTRSDGAHSVEAAYYLRTDDGVVIRVVNKGVGGGARPDAEAAGERFFMFTTPVFEAPRGKYEWINQSVFVGTLGARPDARNAVLIRVFQVV